MIALAFILVFAVGAVIGAWWGIQIYPNTTAFRGDRYAIQYQEGHWLWLKDPASREVLVFPTHADARLGLDRWLRQNPEYLGHCRIVPWRTITSHEKEPSDSDSQRTGSPQ